MTLVDHIVVLPAWAADLDLQFAVKVDAFQSVDLAWLSQIPLLLLLFDIFIKVVFTS